MVPKRYLVSVHNNTFTEIPSNLCTFMYINFSTNKLHLKNLQLQNRLLKTTILKKSKAHDKMEAFGIAYK